MKHQSPIEQAGPEPIDLDVDALSTPDGARHAEGGEVERLRRLVERQFRSNQTLVGLLRAQTGDRPEGKRVEIGARLPRAKWTTRPRSQPAAPTANWLTPGVPPTVPLDAPVGYECQSAGQSIQETAGVSVLGLKGADLENVVASIAEEQRRTNAFKPVFITDQSDFSPFLRRGYAFEYVRPARHFDATRQTERLERLRLLYQRKWGIVRFIERDNARAIDREYPPVALIAKHNGEMSRACHHDRFAWLAETLRLAISLERYDVVPDLADYLFAWFDKIVPATQIAVARALCRKFIAFGETDLLQRFLFKNYTRVSSDDYLFTLFSVHCTNDAEFVAPLAKLPGGKLNSYYISKRMRSAGDQVLPTFLGATEAIAPDANFLLANFFALRKAAEQYRLFVNRGLSRAGHSQLRKLSFASDNVLSTLVFDKRPVARHQTDLVSVIMSCHNSASTLRYAAKSVLDQSYGNLELLICDDNPDNNSLEALGALRTDPRVRIFRSLQSQGTYNIRNNLIAAARGSLITFQDSDDVAFPDRIERQVEFLKERDAAAVCGLWYRVGKTGEFVFSTDHNVARLSVVSLMAPKAVFEAAGPYRSARFGADTEYFENLRRRFGPGMTLTMPSPLLFGLSSETSLTRTAGMEATEDGYRSDARRAYASVAARERLLSWEANDRDLTAQRLEQLDIVLPNAGVVEGDS